MGFVLPPTLERAWRALELTEISAWPAQTAVVAAAHSESLARLGRTLEHRGQTVALKLVPSAGGNADQGALLGNEPLEEIVSLLSERR